MYDEMKKIFSISEEKLDEAILSLTHNQMLNINDSKNYRENFNRNSFYAEIGKQLCLVILKEYIRKNISDDCGEISKSYLAKEDYLDKFFSLYNLKKYMIFQEEVCNKRNLQNITLQFIGFLFLNITFAKFKEIIEKVFIDYSIEIEIDYLSIVNMYLEGKALNFIEVNREGKPNETIFTYELFIDGITVKATGSSKKEAKKKCAEKFCKENLSEEQLKKYLQNGKSKSEHFNEMKISDEKEMDIEKLSQTLKLNKEMVRICCTHKSASNVLNNSTYRTIGAEIEVLLILIYIYNNLNIKDFKRIQEIRTYLNSNTELYQEIVTNLKIEKAMIYRNLDEEGIKKANVDTVKSLIYISFYSDNKVDFVKRLYLNYDNFIKNKELGGLNPTTYVQEITQAYKLDNIQYFVEGNLRDFNCEAVLIINNTSFVYKANGKSKISAKQNAAKCILNDLQSLEEFSKENIYLRKVSNKKLYKEFLSFVLMDENKFNIYMSKNNCFNINKFINGEIHSFAKFLENLFIYLIHEIDLSESLIRIIIESLYKNFFENCICELPIIFNIIANDILGICLTKNILHCHYNFEERKEYIYSESRKIIIEKINIDPSYIKSIHNPDEELQMISIKKNSNLFFEIENPCKNITDYVYENDIRLFYKNNIQRNLDLLIDLKTIEITELIRSNMNNFIIKPHCFDIYIKAIFRLIDIKEVKIAVGFAYKSGIDLIEDEINSVISKNGQVEIVIGTLQKYHLKSFISDMDLDTAKKLNTMINEGIEIRTNQDCFYHGKIYCFIGEKYTVIIMGSTNLSRNAFRNNKELDSMFIFNNIDNAYVKWFDEFWEKSSKVGLLNEEKFKSCFMDNNEDFENKNSISIDEMKKQVNLVSDEMLRNRLLLWLEYNPSKIYENIMLSNIEYFAIEYIEKSMIVLESLIPSNSYFVFYGVEIEQLLKSIENKTKGEIFEMSNMEKRGYHVREQLKLEIKIKSYFL